MKGAAEIIRYILAYGGEDYEDERIQLVDWAKMKESTPMGVLPMLTMVNGKQYHQERMLRKFSASFGFNDHLI